MRAVLAPDGRMWKVGRQWLPFRVRLRRERELPDPSWAGNLFDLADLSLGGILVGLSIAILGAVLLLIVWPLVALAIEVAIVLIVFLVALAGRLVLRRPWRIVARSRSPVRATLAWHVVGWRASGRVIEEVADSLAAGAAEPRPAGAERVLVEDRVNRPA
jgi:hypothetical protein